LGNCYFLASITALAEFPDILKENFLVETKNDAGVYGLKFYVRGKPWVVDIDDYLLFQGDGITY